MGWFERQPLIDCKDSTLTNRNGAFSTEKASAIIRRLFREARVLGSSKNKENLKKANLIHKVAGDYNKRALYCSERPDRIPTNPETKLGKEEMENAIQNVMKTIKKFEEQ